MNPLKKTRHPKQVEGFPVFFAPVPPPPCLPVVRTEGQTEVQRLLNWWDTLLCEQAALLVEDRRQLQKLVGLRAEIGVWEAERARCSLDLQASLLSLWKATKKMNGQKKALGLAKQAAASFGPPDIQRAQSRTQLLLYLVTLREFLLKVPPCSPNPKCFPKASRVKALPARSVSQGQPQLDALLRKVSLLQQEVDTQFQTLKDVLSEADELEGALHQYLEFHSDFQEFRAQILGKLTAFELKITYLHLFRGLS